MIYGLMFFIMIVLTIIALIHLYWAFGFVWPARDGEHLAKSVVGAKGITKMPPGWLTFIVVLLIFSAALWPFAWLHWKEMHTPKWIWDAGMIGLTLIFIGRGVTGYLPFFRGSNCEEPFATLDKRYYSPLCLVIGGAFALLLAMKGL